MQGLTPHGLVLGPQFLLAQHPACCDRVEVASVLLEALSKNRVAGDRLVVAEIGVALAHLGVALLKRFPDLVYFGVDPYAFEEGDLDESGREQRAKLNQEAEQLFLEASLRLRPFFGRAVLLRLPSRVALDWDVARGSSGGNSKS